MTSTTVVSDGIAGFSVTKALSSLDLSCMGSSALRVGNRKEPPGRSTMHPLNTVLHVCGVENASRKNRLQIRDSTLSWLPHVQQPLQTRHLQPPKHVKRSNLGNLKLPIPNCRGSCFRSTPAWSKKRSMSRPRWKKISATGPPSEGTPTHCGTNLNTRPPLRGSPMLATVDRSIATTGASR